MDIRQTENKTGQIDRIARISHRQTVLAVDDAVSNLVAIQSILGETFVVSMASSGEEALKILSRSFVDAAILDIELPGMSGFELFQKMKDTPELREIPVIFVSATHAGSVVRTAVQMGAAGYIIKPYNSRVLLQKVFQALQTSKTDQAARFLIKKLKILHDAAKKEDIDTLIEHFYEIPADIFVPMMALKLNRLYSCISNKDYARVLMMTNDIAADLKEALD